MNKINSAILFAVFLPVIVFTSFSMPLTMAMDKSSMSMMRKKKYMYRKRTHRVQFDFNAVPWSQDSDLNRSLGVNVLYGYNGGFFEVGPNIGISADGVSSSTKKFNFDLNLGAWVEGNFIKNSRKNKIIPSVGLKLNYILEKTNSNTHKVLISPYLSVKFFPASRTGIVLSLNYNVVAPVKEFIKNKKMGIQVGVAYVHYFHKMM